MSVKWAFAVDVPALDYDGFSGLPSRRAFTQFLRRGSTVSSTTQCLRDCLLLRSAHEPGIHRSKPLAKSTQTTKRVICATGDGNAYEWDLLSLAPTAGRAKDESFPVRTYEGGKGYLHAVTVSSCSSRQLV